MNRALERGKRAEREVMALITEQTGWKVRRRLAGQADDCGDLEGVPECCVQIKSYGDIALAIRLALDGLPAQQAAAGAKYGVAFIRRPGGRYVVVMEPATFLTLLREATG